MNAVRILAHELRRSSAQDNTALSSEYCHSIEVLLDFFDGMTALFPAWTDSPGVLKDTLSAAVDALRI
ncbi:hypothetical protein DL93DRAFT_2082538 [Clavulina sp. PMI_390]|nr:hypothetical protein DL93DRAFT_2082538 [Clavulina sp. PMI_390]